MQTLEQIAIRRETLWQRKQRLEGEAWRAFQDGKWAVLANLAYQIEHLAMLIRELDQVMDG